MSWRKVTMTRSKHTHMRLSQKYGSEKSSVRTLKNKTNFAAFLAPVREAWKRRVESYQWKTKVDTPTRLKHDCGVFVCKAQDQEWREMQKVLKKKKKKEKHTLWFPSEIPSEHQSENEFTIWWTWSMSQSQHFQQSFLIMKGSLEKSGGAIRPRYREIAQNVTWCFAHWTVCYLGGRIESKAIVRALERAQLQLHASLKCEEKLRYFDSQVCLFFLPSGRQRCVPH